ncbi:hypothetical protein PDN13_32075, partial [Bacillus cereus]|nr:hypothetical protein [Bacillus cereus]
VLNDIFQSTTVTLALHLQKHPIFSYSPFSRGWAKTPYYLLADIKLLRTTQKATRYVVEVKNTAVAVHWIPKSILNQKKEIPDWFIKEKKLFLI